MQIAQLSPVVARSSSGIGVGWSSSSSGSTDKVLSRCLEDDAMGVVGVSRVGVAGLGIGSFSELEAISKSFRGTISSSGVDERTGVAGVEPGGLVTLGNPFAA